MLKWFGEVHNVRASRYSLPTSLMSHTMFASSVQMLRGLSLHDGLSAYQADKEVCFHNFCSTTRQVHPSCVLFVLRNQITLADSNATYTARCISRDFRRVSTVSYIARALHEDFVLSDILPDFNFALALDMVRAFLIQHAQELVRWFL
jgi:hypothetical protein